MSELESTQRLTRTEVAEYLRTFADQLETGERRHLEEGERHHLETEESSPLSAGLYDETDARRSGDDAPAESTPQTERTGGTDSSAVDTDQRMTFLVGNDSATVNPPREVQFSVEVGDDSSLVGTDTDRHVTFDLTWHAEDVADDDTLDVE